MVKIQEITLAGFDPICFFQKLGGMEKSPAFFTSGRWTVIAWDPRSTFVSKDASALYEAKKSLIKRQRSPHGDLPFTGGIIGYVSYDAGLELQGVRSKHRSSFQPAVCFHRYDQALLFDGERIILIGDKNFLQHVQEIHHRPLQSTRLDPISWKASVDRAQYGKAFSRIKRGITEGDYYQLNFTYQFHAKPETRNPKSEGNPKHEFRSSKFGRTLFAALQRHNRAPCSSYFEDGESAILSCSPERFVTIDKGVIRTSPIKGTRPRSPDPWEDEKLAADLLKNEKEEAELNMITDLLRNDVGKVSLPGTVKVVGHRLLQKNPSVWHTYSVIEGRLDPAIHPLDAFASMFPGGSVTGCPKDAAMEEIDQLEHAARGPYCGSMVLLSDHGFLDSSILIRTIVKDGSKLSLGVGGGIVADSTLEQEFQETQKKAERFMTLPSRSVWINGRVAKHPPSLKLRGTGGDPRLKMLDPSFKNSFGVFETMRVKNGKIEDLKAHMKRLKGSAEIVGMKLPPSPLPPLPRGEGNTRLKVVCTPKNFIVETSPLVLDPSIHAGVAVTVAKLERRDPEAKALPYHREWTAYQVAVQKGFHEALLRNRKGEITEGAISNLFFVRKNVLHTANVGMLPGISRANVLRLAKRLKIPVEFGTPSLADLHAADEIFLTRSTVGIAPVVAIDGRRIGKGKPGPMTGKLMKYLLDSPRP